MTTPLWLILAFIVLFLWLVVMSPVFWGILGFALFAELTIYFYAKDHPTRQNHIWHFRGLAVATAMIVFLFVSIADSATKPSDLEVSFGVVNIENFGDLEAFLREKPLNLLSKKSSFEDALLIGHGDENWSLEDHDTWISVSRYAGKEASAIGYMTNVGGGIGLIVRREKKGVAP